MRHQGDDDKVRHIVAQVLDEQEQRARMGLQREKIIAARRAALAEQMELIDA